MRVKKWEWICLGLMIALIVFTRALGLTHEMVNHPDEHVFVQGSTSLRDVLLEGAEYTETKPYPEGSYFFYLPFQLLAALVGRISGIEQSARVWNRAAAVVYFCIGGAAGFGLVKKRFGGGRALVLYAVLLVFSLIHIEQSRYGTGDAISFALLMLMISATASWIDGGRSWRLYAAAVLVGFLGAVKYPLVYFALVPLTAVFLARKDKKERAVHIAVGVALVLGAFLLLSPEVIKDFRYIIDVCRREIKAYMLMGNRSEVGGPLNHVFAMIAYWTLYSDLLFAPVFAAIGLRAILGKKKNSAEAAPGLCVMHEKRGLHDKAAGMGEAPDGDKEKRTPMQTFFGIALPLIALGFLGYNVFVTALFMRTIYPFFCIALPYAAAGLANVWENKRIAAGVLIGLTVLRGALFIGAYLPETAVDTLDAAIAQAQQISGGRRFIGLAANRYVTGHWTALRDKYPQMEIVDLDELRDGEYPVLQSGDIVVTGPLEMARAKKYVFPIADTEVQACIDGWAQFKEDNAEYYIGQSYPQWYAAAFGFWINGVVAEFDFPMNYVYAVP